MAENIQNLKPEAFFGEAVRPEVRQTHEEFYLVAKAFSPQGALDLMRYHDVGPDAKLEFALNAPLTPTEEEVAATGEEGRKLLAVYGVMTERGMHRYITRFDEGTAAEIDTDPRVSHLKYQLANLAGTVKKPSLADISKGRQDREVVYTDEERQGRKLLNGELVRVKYSILLGRRALAILPTDSPNGANLGRTGSDGA